MKDKTFPGGRNGKAPYTSSVVRVPDPLVPTVEKMMALYREKIVSGSPGSDQTLRAVFMETFVDQGLDSYLIDSAKEILEKRGTRKDAMKKLLQVILCRNIKEKEIEN